MIIYTRIHAAAEISITMRYIGLLGVFSSWFLKGFGWSFLED